MRHQHFGSAISIIPLFVIGFGACGDVTSDGWDPYPGLRLDGDRVEPMVVKNVTPRWTDTDRWTIGAEPVLRLGLTDGAPEYQFHDVVGVYVGDGRVLVADGGSKQLRMFSANGTHLKTVGGEGAGPGEFNSIEWMKPYREGELLLWDFILSRGSVFTTQGEFVNTVSLPSLPGYPLAFPMTTFADGSILAQAGPPHDETDPEGRLWKVVGAFRIMPGPADQEQTFLGTFPSQYVPNERCELDTGCAREYGGIWAQWNTTGNRLVYARADVPEILMYDPEDRSAQLVRRDAESPIESAPPGAAVPAFYDALYADEDGYVWARRQGSDTWTVIDSSGVWLGDLALPSKITIHHISDGILAGVTQDELGVERVVLHEIRR